uniref:Uncharacterized protein n=1 Tax=Zea mays TaxID=4577 RepID=A0A804QL95_MAIZE
MMTEIRSTNRKCGDEALAELVTVMFWVAPEDEWAERNSSPELSLEFGRKLNFNELVMEAYGCELSCRRAVVAWMAAALLQGYREDESMINSFRPNFGSLTFGTIALKNDEGKGNEESVDVVEDRVAEGPGNETRLAIEVVVPDVRREALLASARDDNP